MTAQGVTIAQAGIGGLRLLADLKGGRLITFTVTTAVGPGGAEVLLDAISAATAFGSAPVRLTLEPLQQAFQIGEDGDDEGEGKP